MIYLLDLMDIKKRQAAIINVKEIEGNYQVKFLSKKYLVFANITKKLHTDLKKNFA